jgi:hypothetical protein
MRLIKIQIQSATMKAYSLASLFFAFFAFFCGYSSGFGGADGVGI